ncbi:efflux transporter outer membrane subunit [Bordetella sp. FB-8]|uniref:efflux transporter outer membrane subunit n=1 Tax=Bordetella sp. FB-8 TaxID=1159870 RepID=UPI00037D5457|nr:efflux transporter outer membrane subunit [Bordetella sp. FB-8]
MTNTIRNGRTAFGRTARGRASLGRASLGYAALPLLLALAGCAVGPDYRRPPVDTPAAYKEAASTQAAMPADQAGSWQQARPAENALRGQWWKIFKDPTLDALQVQAQDANQNLKAAAARLGQSRALVRNARSDRYPELDAGFGPTRERASPASQGRPDNGAATYSSLWRAQASVSYEVDLFGRVASSVNAATADAQQSAALYRSVLLALQADVAQGYFRVRELDAEQQIYRRTVELRGKTMALIRHRYDAGDVGELDLDRARTDLESARAEQVGIARDRAVAEHALAVLLGKTPAEFSLPAQPIARIAIDIPAGMPSSLLERRPDIAAAERAMAAANARIGVAKAAFFPSLMLTGAGGLESSALGDLFNWSSRTFLLGPLVGTALSLPIFDGGRRQANLDRARAVYEEDVADYRQTVLTAFREVEDNLAGLRLLHGQTAAQDAALRAATRAAQLSQMQYREGAVSYLDVLEADRTALQQQRASAQLDGDRARTVVNLIRALGGGWGLAAPRIAAE